MNHSIFGMASLMCRVNNLKLVENVPNEYSSHYVSIEFKGFIVQVE